jgi:sialate O-acetylesterase
MITLLNIFQDNMILQRDTQIKIIGTSDLKELVEIVLNDSVLYQGLIDIGRFTIILEKQNALYDGTLKISSPSTTLIFQHVDIGEVWIAGGQSNMEFPVKFASKLQVNSFNNPHIRYYDCPKISFLGEEKDGFKNEPYMGKWLSLDAINIQNFSAIGTYFANNVFEQLNVPIGIIGCNYGGTSLFAWLDEKYMIDELGNYLLDYQKAISKLNLAKYYQQSLKARRLIASPLMQKMNDNMLSGITNSKDTFKALPSALKVIAFTIKKGPHALTYPSCLFKNMILPIAGYSCKGFLYYQGESDIEYAKSYSKLFSQVILSYRELWEYNLPFLFVQLAPYKSSALGSGKHFPIIRSEQEKVSKTIDNTYMISIMDAGMEHDIHPKKKEVVGKRLADIALGKIYKFDLVCENPEIKEVVLEDKVCYLKFNNVGTGLSIQGSKVNDLQIIVGKKELKNYTFELLNDSIKIIHPILKKDSKVIINYSQTPYADVNLFNSALFPIKPFSKVIF